MKLKLIVLILLFPFLINAQSLFIKEISNQNPIKDKDNVKIADKILVHEQYYNDAKKTKDVKKQFYGLLFLTDDYFNHSDFVQAKKYNYEAELVAMKQNNSVWLAEIEYRKGYISYSMLEMIDSSIGYFRNSIEYSKKDNDSIAIISSLDQIACMYRVAEKYDSSQAYYNIILPFISTHQLQNEYGYIYGNYANLLVFEKKFKQAEIYLDTAIIIAQNRKEYRREISTKWNKVALYRHMGQFDKAIALAKELILINEKNNWIDQKIGNLYNISLALKEKGDFKQAYEANMTFFSLRDSVIGEDVRIQQAELDAKYEKQKNELRIAKSHQVIERYRWFFVVFILLILMSSWIWYKQMGTKKKEQQDNIENLNQLTRLLVDKNERIQTLESTINSIEIKKTLAEIPTVTSSVVESHQFINFSILTPQDWLSFKQYFDKAYPNFIFRMRGAYPALTESEERLFMLIKLNIKTKEVASILGISDDSVKKSRSRLRKRLALSEDIDLNTFISMF